MSERATTKPDRSIWTRMGTPIGAFALAVTTLTACENKAVVCDPNQVKKITAGLTSETQHKDYTTIWDIANDYKGIDNTDLEPAIKNLNHLSTYELQAGQTYVVPLPGSCK